MKQQEAFYTWLSSFVPQSRLSDYFLAIADVESYAKKKKLIFGSIFDIADPTLIQKISNAVGADRFFRLLHKKQMKSIAECCDYLKRFLKENSNRSIDAPPSQTDKEHNKDTKSQSSTIIRPVLQSESSDQEMRNSGSADAPVACTNSETEGSKSIAVVDFLSSTDYSFTKPTRITYFGEEFFETSWKALYARVSKLLYEDYPQVFAEQVKQPSSNSKGKLIYSEAELSQVRVPSQIEPGLYIETNRSATEIVRNIKRLLDLCNVDYENLVINYLRPGEEPSRTDADHSISEQTGSEKQINRELNSEDTVISRIVTSEKSTNESEPDFTEVDELLRDERFGPLRESLSRNGIRSIDELKAIKLWPFMNHHDLYSIGMRQTILEQVNTLLYPKSELDDSQLFVLRVGDTSYEGSSPSVAFSRFCDSFSTRFPLQFRLLIGAKIRDSNTVPVQKNEDEVHHLKLTNVTAYIAEGLSKTDVVRYAGWICVKCGEAPVEVSASEPADHVEPKRTQDTILTDNKITEDNTDHVDQMQNASPSGTDDTSVTEEESDITHETEPEPVKEQGLNQEPVSSMRASETRSVDPFVSKIEREVLKADIDGTSYEAVKNCFGLTMVATKQMIEDAPHIVDINGRLIHEEAFIDWEDGADQLEALLDKLMQKNDGYVSSSQLYDYAKAEMTMFLNDNDINEERAVYDMAQHLFAKVKYHGKQYKFTGKTHISDLKDDISTNLDVYRKYAAAQGGVFSFSELVEYLGRIGLGTGNLRTQMRVYSEPVFFCYDNGIYMYSDFMSIDAAWKSTVKKALNVLLTEVGGHIILRELPEEWLAQLPLLPQNRPWTPLLLQSILRWYGKELGARTISAMDGQAADTLHTMLVTLDNPIQSFGDVVITWLVETENDQRDFEAEELRRNLVEAGIIQGNELIWNMPKALKQDERFAWDAGGAHVRVEVR